jgi:retron-type reverse transcriptase
MPSPPHSIARALAAAFLDGPWERDGLLARGTRAIGEQAWLARLVGVMLYRQRLAPDHDVERLADWLVRRRAFRVGMQGRHTVRWWATPAPEMLASASRWDVPPLATTHDLATWLGLAHDELVVLADLRGISRRSSARARHYHYAWRRKAAGGHRLIEAPKPRLRAVQRRILDGILACVPPHPAAHAYRVGHSIATAAEPHVGRDVVIRVDLTAFFTSVFAGRVIAIARALGYPFAVAHTLAALCTHATPGDVLSAGPERDHASLSRLRGPHLPQGAPTSGALANLASYGLDVRLTALAARIGARYTRYADDLVFSADRSAVAGATTLAGEVGAIAHDEGFAVSFRKTRVMTQASRQRVTGLVVNSKLAVPRAERERLHAILYNATRTGPDAQNRDGHADFRAHLLGRIAHVAAVEPRHAARLRAMFERIRW